MKIKIEFDAGDQLVTLEELKRHCEATYIRLVVGRYSTRELAAAALGITRKSLWERIRRLGMTDLTKGPPEPRPVPNRTVTEPVSVAA